MAFGGTYEGLTKTESRLLEVLLDPRNRLKTVEEICTIAKCGRTTYYRAFRKPHFVEIYRAEAQEALKREIAPLINSLVKEAKHGSYQHLKIALEMLGLYAEKLQVDATLTFEEALRQLVGAPTVAPTTEG